MSPTSYQTAPPRNIIVTHRPVRVNLAICCSVLEFTTVLQFRQLFSPRPAILCFDIINRASYAQAESKFRRVV